MANLPPISSLRAFEAVVRLGSVTRAAAELGRTHGAVSKQLRVLQEHIGASLFERAGTGLAPTAAGRTLAGGVAAAMAGLAQAYASAAAELRGPALQVACSVTFATRWLAPNLAAFSRLHPQVRVRLAMTSARELRDEGADLVLAWDWRSWPAADQLRAIRVADVAFGPVCAPGCPIDRAADGSHGVPVRIGHDFTTRAWTQWEQLSGLRLTALAQVAFPHTHLGIEAAAAGMGVALVERRLVARELREGTLVAPFGFTSFPDGLAAISAARGQSAAAVAFVDWLRDGLK